MEYILLLLILFISICESLGQSCLKYFHMTENKTRYYLLGIMFYAIVCYLLIQSYKYKSMGIVNVLWSGLSVLVILSTGILFFDEKITKMDIMGVVFIVGGIFCVLYEGPHPDIKK